jgi:murein DD-endopeptidase MepM/ murein hydrolase activator NlpD
MIISPIQNSGKFDLNWVQIRPKVSQKFGKNPAMYEPFGMKGHNGLDFGVPIGTPIYAPMDGVIKVIDSKSAGYGLHIKIRNSYKKLECVLGHLSRTDVKDGAKVIQGQKLGVSGNTGFSTGPHLHAGLRTLRSSDKGVWGWDVENYNNGYFGYWDFSPYLISWKGTIFNNNL